MTRSGSSAAIGPELAAFLDQGVAAIVATRDGRMQPAGSASRANLEENGEIAITFSLPTTYRSVQVKGRATLGGDATPEQRSRVEAHIERFVAQVEQIGMARDHALRMPVPPFAAVTCSVRELYDQTPGAGAGAPL